MEDDDVDMLGSNSLNASHNDCIYAFSIEKVF